jgi:hypothetical protein
VAVGALTLAIAVAAAPAIGDDLVADRPGFGESANVVARRNLQVEAGATFTLVSRDAHFFDAPRALVRYGIGGSLELRADAPDWVTGRGLGQPVSGWGDLDLGLKWHASLAANDLTLRGTLTLPAGEAGLTDERADPSGAVAWSRALSGPWSIGATVGARHYRAYDTGLVAPSVSLAHSLGPHAATFVEYGGSFATRSRPLHQVDNGYTWDPRPDTQLDVSFGIGLSPAAPAFFVGLGVSRRF